MQMYVLYFIYPSLNFDVINLFIFDNYLYIHLSCYVFSLFFSNVYFGLTSLLEKALGSRIPDVVPFSILIIPYIDVEFNSY
jgi:hypothetical protein